MEKDVISDVDAHDDLIRLDYLEHREEKLEKLLKESGHLSREEYLFLLSLRGISVEEVPVENEEEFLRRMRRREKERVHGSLR